MKQQMPLNAYFLSYAKTLFYLLQIKPIYRSLLFKNMKLLLTFEYIQPFHNGHIFNEPFQAANNNNNVVKHSLITYSFFPKKLETN